MLCTRNVENLCCKSAELTVIPLTISSCLKISSLVSSPIGTLSPGTLTIHDTLLPSVTEQLSSVGDWVVIGDKSKVSPCAGSSRNAMVQNIIE